MFQSFTVFIKMSSLGGSVIFVNKSTRRKHWLLQIPHLNLLSINLTAKYHLISLNCFSSHFLNQIQILRNWNDILELAVRRKHIIIAFGFRLLIIFLYGLDFSWRLSGIVKLRYCHHWINLSAIKIIKLFINLFHYPLRIFSSWFLRTIIINGSPLIIYRGTLKNILEDSH